MSRGGGSLVDGVERIAVLRATALGDFVMALPALDALRSAYPNAEITLLARPWHRAFLAGRPGAVDRVLVVPEGAVGDEAIGDRPDARAAFFESVAQERFDLALQMHGGGRHSNPFVRRLGARVAAGCRTPDAAALDRTIPYVYYQSEVIRNLEIAALVGATRAPLEPRIEVTRQDVDEAQAVLADVGIERVRERPLVVFHPGASDPRRRWPAERFSTLGARLRERRSVPSILVTGTAGEADVTADVARGIGDGATDLCGRLSLNGLTGLVSLAAVVVSNDTGPLHLARAVGAPTVGIYWCGNLITAGPATRSRSRALISWRIHCPRCGLDCTSERCPHEDSFVADVAADEVVAEACSLLER